MLASDTPVMTEQRLCRMPFLALGEVSGLSSSWGQDSRWWTFWLNGECPPAVMVPRFRASPWMVRKLVEQMLERSGDF